MNRSGRSLPRAGDHAACLIRMVSAGVRDDLVVKLAADRQHNASVPVGQWRSAEGLNQGFLDAAQPRVHLERGGAGVYRIQILPLLLELLADFEPDT